MGVEEEQNKTTEYSLQLCVSFKLDGNLSSEKEVQRMSDSK